MASEQWKMILRVSDLCRFEAFNGNVTKNNIFRKHYIGMRNMANHSILGSVKLTVNKKLELVYLNRFSLKFDKRESSKIPYCLFTFNISFSDEVTAQWLGTSPTKSSRELKIPMGIKHSLNGMN